MNVRTFFNHLWQQSLALCPEVGKVDAVLLDHGEQSIVNDHIAFRTLSGSNTGLGTLLPLLENMGYQPKGQYRFETKKLNAIHLEHPDHHPKIFISELCLDEFSKSFQALLGPVVAALSAMPFNDPSIFYSGRQWSINWETYDQLIAQSEYAGWFYAFGYIANHFTVSINDLQTFQSLETVNDYLESKAFELNAVNGKIKGSEELYLKQSATLAFHTSVEGLSQNKTLTRTIPGIFREMAERFPLPSGELFQGFVEGNADSIFESTHLRKT